MITMQIKNRNPAIQNGVPRGSHSTLKQTLKMALHTGAPMSAEILSINPVLRKKSLAISPPAGRVALPRLDRLSFTPMPAVYAHKVATNNGVGSGKPRIVTPAPKSIKLAFEIRKSIFMAL